MERQDDTGNAPAPSRTGKSERQRREAEALRRNLMRRKTSTPNARDQSE